VIAFALPLFVIVGWSLKGWSVAAVLWAAGQAVGALLTRLPLGTSNLAAAGMRGIGMSFRGFAAGVVLLVVTLTDEAVGLAALVVYVLAFTLELAVSLAAYFGSGSEAAA
jgi:hypothetical protein